MPPRRRDRRTPADPNRAAPARQPPPAEAAAASYNKRFRYLYPFVGLFSLLASVGLYYLIARRSPASPLLLSAYERGLVKPDVSYREILAEHSTVSKNSSRRHFPNPVLAYITPWNSKGYEMAKLYSAKLTHLSPVWYELKSEGKRLVLEGRHNADAGWISELRMIGHSLVLPRVVVEAFPGEFLPRKKEWSKAIDVIVAECKVMRYDGIVLESWSRWAAYGVLRDPDMRSMALQFIRQLGQALHSVSSDKNASQHLELIFVIPPARSQNLGEHDFGPQDLRLLSDAVDGFSLMTYDFSGPQAPGPNAPLSWIQSSLHVLLGDIDDSSRSLAHMIFVGINFYGNDFMLPEGGGAITGRDYINLLEKHQPMLRWEEKSAEHFFLYTSNKDRHAVFYPSLMSISMRLDQAQVWGAGFSIWEIGQGLDYFFDLL